MQQTSAPPASRGSTVVRPRVTIGETAVPFKTPHSRQTVAGARITKASGATTGS